MTDATTTALAPRPQSFEELQKWSESFADSSLIAAALQKKPSDVLVVLQKGLELGLQPMQSLENISVIRTRDKKTNEVRVNLQVSADMMVALCLRDPRCEYFRWVSSSSTEAIFETKRVGDPPKRRTWTIKRAQDMNLTGKYNWRSMPENMLIARCKSELARLVYPDIVGGLYSSEELGDHLGPAAPVKGVIEVSNVVQLPKSQPSHGVDGRVIDVIPVSEAGQALEAAKSPLDEWDFDSMTSS